MNKGTKLDVIMENVNKTTKDERIKLYYKKMRDLEEKRFPSYFRDEWEKNVNLIKSKKVLVKNVKLTGIFRKTPGAIKSSSGVTFGYGGVKEDGKG